VTGGAADGFMLLFHTMPGGLRDFVEHVVPELQRRGMMRIEYETRTLRGHLGFKHPPSRYAGTFGPATTTVAAE
jgi:hypothetical protein